MSGILAVGRIPIPRADPVPPDWTVMRDDVPDFGTLGPNESDRIRAVRDDMRNTHAPHFIDLPIPVLGGPPADVSALPPPFTGVVVTGINPWVTISPGETVTFVAVPASSGPNYGRTTGAMWQVAP